MKVEEAEVLARSYDVTKLSAKERKLLVSLIYHYRDYYTGVIAFLLHRRR